MTLREELAQDCQRFLEPGEQVRYVFLGETHLPVRRMIFIFQWSLLVPRHRVVCVTDRSVAILRSDDGGYPKKVLLRRERDQMSCLMSHMAGEVVVGRKHIRVYRMFHDDVGAADTELRRVSRGRPIPLEPIRVRYELE